MESRKECEGELVFTKNQKVLDNIFGYLDARSLHIMSLLLSKDFYEVSIRNSLWRIHTEKRFSEYKGFKTGDEKEGSWKNRFVTKTLNSPTIADIVRNNRDTYIYTCSNYHPYLLMDCRIPKKMLTCGVCNERTGGMIHKLCPGNRCFGNLSQLRFRHAPSHKIRLFDLEKLLRLHGKKFEETSGIEYLNEEEIKKFGKFQRFV